MAESVVADHSRIGPASRGFEDQDALAIDIMCLEDALGGLCRHRADVTGRDRTCRSLIDGNQAADRSTDDDLEGQERLAETLAAIRVRDSNPDFAIAADMRQAVSFIVIEPEVIRIVGEQILHHGIGAVQ